MENRVGENVPPPEQMDDLEQGLQNLADQLDAFCITLTTEERQQALHARKDANPHIQTIHDLSAKHNISIPDMSREDMMKDLDLRDRLHPLTALLKLAHTKTKDTETEAESEMWQVFLAHYAVLSSMSEHIPELQAALSPVKKFMASRRRQQTSERES